MDFPGSSNCGRDLEDGKLIHLIQEIVGLIMVESTVHPCRPGPKFADGTIQCITQDYFEENASRGDIWYLRGVL